MDRILEWPLRLGFDNLDVTARDGTRLRVVIGGPKAGRRVVLLHGAPQFSYTWRRVMPLLGDRYRVVVPDLRGYGASDLAVSGRYDLDTLTADLEEVVAATGGSEPVLLVGHDWGGPIAWQFALSRPASVRHLVAVNGPHPSAFARELLRPRQTLRSWYIGLFQVPKLEKIIELTDARLFVWMMKTSAPPGAINQEDLGLYREALARPGRAKAVLAYYRESFGPGLLERRRRFVGAPDTQVPATVVWAEDDKALAPTHPDAIRPYARRLEVRRLPGVSHWVPEERPGEVARAVTDADSAAA